MDIAFGVFAQYRGRWTNRPGLFETAADAIASAQGSPGRELRLGRVEVVDANTFRPHGWRKLRWYPADDAAGQSYWLPDAAEAGDMPPIIELPRKTPRKGA